MNYQKVYKYFIGQSGIDDHFFEKDSNGKKYTGKFVIDNKDCKLKSFQKIFGTTINSLAIFLILVLLKLISSTVPE